MKRFAAFGFCALAALGVLNRPAFAEEKVYYFVQGQGQAPAKVQPQQVPSNQTTATTNNTATVAQPDSQTSVFVHQAGGVQPQQHPASPAQMLIVPTAGMEPGPLPKDVIIVPATGAAPKPVTPRVIKQEPAQTPMPAPQVEKLKAAPQPVVVYGNGYAPGQPCCDTGCEYPSPWRVIAGAGLYFAQPYWEANPAYLIINSEPGATNSRQEEFHYDWDVSPRFWARVEHCDGYIFQARWWHFDHGAGASVVDAETNLNYQTLFMYDGGGTETAGTPANPGTLDVASDLELDVVDLETVHNCPCGCWEISFSYGLRYAYVNQGYDFSIARGDGLERDGRYSRVFRGGGPQAGIQFRRPLDSCQPGLTLFGGSRLALLYGRTEELYSQLNTDGSSEVTVLNFFGFSNDRDDLMPVLELEAGVEYVRWIGCRELFLQAALASQTWFGAGNSSGSENFGFDGSISQTMEADSNLGFLGLLLSAGVRY